MDDLTSDGLVAVGTLNGGEQRRYRWGQWGLSLVNAPMLHRYPFAWEAAVIKFNGPDDHRGALDYSTLLTADVEVFHTDKEANAFIEMARRYFVEGISPSEPVFRRKEV